MARALVRTLVLISVVAVAGCGAGLLPEFGGRRGAEVSAVWRDDIRLRLTGVLADPDAEPAGAPQCPVLLTDDGRIFALVGDLDRVGPGDRVEIAGPPAIWSTCQTFQVLRVDELRLLARWAPGA